MRVEVLETRAAPSSVTLAGGLLTLAADGDPWRAVLTASPRRVTVILPREGTLTLPRSCVRRVLLLLRSVDRIVGSLPPGLPVTRRTVLWLAEP